MLWLPSCSPVVEFNACFTQFLCTRCEILIGFLCIIVGGNPGPPLLPTWSLMNEGPSPVSSISIEKSMFPSLPCLYPFQCQIKSWGWVAHLWWRYIKSLGVGGHSISSACDSHSMWFEWIYIRGAQSHFSNFALDTLKRKSRWVRPFIVRRRWRTTWSPEPHKFRKVMCEWDLWFNMGGHCILQGSTWRASMGWESWVFPLGVLSWSGRLHSKTIY